MGGAGDITLIKKNKTKIVRTYGRKNESKKGRIRRDKKRRIRRK
jgi:hypothetical protein